MASRRLLPTDPVFLLEYMENIESDISDDEFDGYIDEEEGVCGGGIGNNNREGVCSDMLEEELDDREGVCSDVFEEELGCGSNREGVCSDVFEEELGCGSNREGLCSDVFEEELGCEEPMEVELPQSTTALPFQSSIPPFTPIPGVTEKNGPSAASGHFLQAFRQSDDGVCGGRDKQVWRSISPKPL